jgi:Zn-dependent protease
MPFGTIVHHNEKLRLGKFRYGIMHGDIARIALSGILANVFFALFLRLIFPTLNLQFINNLVKANAFLAIYTILPIPPLNGFHIFFNNRLLYFFWAGFIISLSALIITSTAVLPLLIYGILGGGVTVLLLYFLYEKD